MKILGLPSNLLTPAVVAEFQRSFATVDIAVWKNTAGEVVVDSDEPDVNAQDVMRLENPTAFMRLAQIAVRDALAAVKGAAHG